MTFPEALQAHTGGLLRLKTGLFWYGGPGWDRSPGRVCLLLDVHHAASRPHDGREAHLSHAVATSAAAAGAAAPTTALLLIDDRPQWVWVTEADVELIT